MIFLITTLLKRQFHCNFNNVENSKLPYTRYVLKVVFAPTDYQFLAVSEVVSLSVVMTECHPEASAFEKTAHFLQSAIKIQ
jgi:hypothetical protein